MEYKAVIFDLDGVLCSTDRYHYKAWKQVAESLGIPFDETTNHRLRGVSRMESLNIILEGYAGTLSQEDKEELADKKNTIYKELLQQMTAKDLSGEVKHTLEELRKQGKKLAIGSSSRNAGFILRQLGLAGYFDAVSDGTNIARSKPDPEVFLKAAQLLNLQPEECLVVEDAEAGITAACAGGFQSAGIGEAAGSRNVTYPLRTFGELLKIRRIDWKKKPFYLNDRDIEWVERTYRSMSIEEKIGQLFCPIGYSTEPDYLRHELLDKHIGGLFFRDGMGKEMQATFAFAQAHSRIPLLIPSNLEAGGDGAAIDGTAYGKQMAVAAAADTAYAYRLGEVAASEAAALGINWAFAPVVDIDMNFRNPITNVRTYGADKETVVKNALEYMRAAAKNQVAVSLKHFPGDGVDERDQHILTSVNSLSTEEWDDSFGYVYRELIEAGALTVMAGHIALPAYEEYYNPEAKEELIPATLSKGLLQGLLREKLGFQGLIITDATPMVGFTAAMERKNSIPMAIEAGCDMILFNKDLAEDYAFMLEGYRTGILSGIRLRDAVCRILAAKAALKLHVKKEENRLVPGEKALRILKSREHVEWAGMLADQSITLVKDTQNLLPLNPAKYKRVLLEMIGDCASNERIARGIQEELEKRGYGVTLYEKEDFAKGVDNVTMIKSKYDLVLYIGNVENASNKTTNRINWYTFFGQGNNVPWFVKEVPTVFASLANPYHLFDVPMIQTYINCYSNNQYVVEALVKKLCGESAFKGISPIDPFCGRKELKY